jgi:hypothetical protein
MPIGMDFISRQLQQQRRLFKRRAVCNGWNILILNNTTGKCKVYF